ncbi:MAG: inositol monophosphatase [Geminicoccaceae bacterium]|nr:inositol monophosphatase [Geminicoccaceae bacterium]
MNDHDLARRAQAAAATIREAGRLARRHFERRDRLEIEFKGMQDLVSLADRATEDLIRARLGEAFPDDAFVGEEGGGEDAPPGTGQWVIDPIDGTMNFLRGLPYWSVVIAYVKDRDVLLGLTYDPVHDELYAAEKGRGAFRNGERIRVSGTTDPRSAVLGQTFSFKMEIEPYVRTLKNVLGAGADHRRLGSTALMMCHVADGRLDGCITLRCSSWDVIAGLRLVLEAGGEASDWFESAGSLTAPGSVFGCTPGLRATVRTAGGFGR